MMEVPILGVNSQSHDRSQSIHKIDGADAGGGGLKLEVGNVVGIFKKKRGRPRKAHPNTNASSAKKTKEEDEEEDAQARQKQRRRVVEVINKLMWLASVCTSVAFMAYSYIVVGRKYEWAAILITVVGGVIMAGVLRTMTYYVVRSKKTRKLRKKEKIAKSGSNSWLHSESNSEVDRNYAI